MTFAQRLNRLTTHFSERIPIVKQRLAVNVEAMMGANYGGADKSLAQPSSRYILFDG